MPGSGERAARTTERLVDGVALNHDNLTPVGLNCAGRSRQRPGHGNVAVLWRISPDATMRWRTSLRC